MIISEVTFDNRTILLCGYLHNRENNVFTLIVGRNGCGKSVLFKKICQISILSILNKRTPYSYDPSENSKWIENGSMTYIFANTTNRIEIKQDEFNLNQYHLGDIPENERAAIIETIKQHHLNDFTLERSSDNKLESDNFTHPRIIAVSSSPFDKFPLADRTTSSHQENQLKSYYYYRGARTDYRMSKSYLKSKFDQLGASFISFFLKHEDRKNEILPLFEYLGLSSKFKIILKDNDHISLDQIIRKENYRTPIDAVQSSRFFKGIARGDDNLSEEDQNDIIRSAKVLYNDATETNSDRNKLYTLELDLDPDHESQNSSQSTYLKELSTLVKFDLIDLENIEFNKIATNSRFLLSEASSGELCILFNILSIAAEITNNTVILLDEPELSLHPEWQQDFLPLLSTIFSHYKQCHFIIATHSPQIVSSITTSNSYIVNLEDNPTKILEGKEASSQSLDYQLAQVFKAPGNRNEYLISQAVEALTAIRDGQKPDHSFLTKVNELMEFHNIVPDNDPAQKLLSTLQKALSVITK